ncbi:hypothetical protein [Roseovarius pacificus]|uniref:hypothetical protein n=1 Tax=Roseovarius pacificus TaxID=337701 RepID=UPI002A18E2AE|nr:hypothetical protein [Roseovarius pacificus]
MLTSKKRSPQRAQGAKRQTRADIEGAIQRAFFQMVSVHAGPDVLIWSCPNEGNRGKVQTAKLKAMGLLPGAADVIAIWEGGGLLIEFKSPEAYRTAHHGQSGAQQEFQGRAQRVGWPYVVVARWEDAWHQLEAHGAPLARVLRETPMTRFVVPSGAEAAAKECAAAARRGHL